MKFVAGLFTGLLLAAALPLAILAAGGFDVAATAPPGALDRLAPWARERSIARRAGDFVAPPSSREPAALAAGLARYRSDCVVCHGAPGVEIGAAGRGLHPVPPLLDAPATQARSDGQLFWIVKHGIRFTGMPGWGGTRSDDEIWALVAFMRRLPRLSPDETAALSEPSVHLRDSRR